MGLLDKILPFVSEAFSSPGGKNWGFAAGSQDTRNDIARNTAKASNWDISSNAAKQRAAGNKNIADRRIANIENRIDSLKPQQVSSSVSSSYIPMSFSAGSGVYRNPFSISGVQDTLLKNDTKDSFEDNAYNDVKDINGNYDLNGNAREQRKSALRQQQANNARQIFINNAEQARQEITDAREKQAAAEWNRKAARLYGEYQRAADARDSTYDALGLSAPGRALSAEDLGLTPGGGNSGTHDGGNQTPSDGTVDNVGVESSENAPATSESVQESPYAAYIENGYFDENAYIADLMDAAESEYWSTTFPALLEKYHAGEISDADLYTLINMMSWDEFHDFATNEDIYDPLYSNAFIMDEYGNRERVDLNDPYDWDRYVDFYGGMNLQDEAEAGNWANVGAITGVGTNVAGQQISNMTGYNPMTGETYGGWTDNSGNVHGTVNDWAIPVSTKDFEQTYGAFVEPYGLPEGGYDTEALTPEQKYMMAGVLADIIGRDAYEEYLGGNAGAYNQSQYALDNDNVVDDFYMINDIAPYFSNIGYYSSRGQ